jgi:organic hydroperoxide reductase OsmC/OhrA
MPYPFKFTAHTHSSSGIQKTWNTEASMQTSVCAVPPEFAGPGGGLSPEDLFNQALANCFVGTFKVFAQNSKLEFTKVEVSSDLIVDLDENKKPVMKEFYLVAKIYNPNQADKAMLLAQKASQSGFILNSVKTKCHFDFQIIENA